MCSIEIFCHAFYSAKRWRRLKSMLNCILNCFFINTGRCGQCRPIWSIECLRLIVLDSRRYAALSLSRVYSHNSNNRNKCWLFPVRFRFSIRKTIHLNSVLLQKYQFYLKKMTLIVQARGHRRQQLTIINSKFLFI